MPTRTDTTGANKNKAKRPTSILQWADNFQLPLLGWGTQILEPEKRTDLTLINTVTCDKLHNIHKPWFTEQRKTNK